MPTQRLRHFVLLVATAMIAAYLVLLGAYLVSPIFFDHAEAQFPGVTWYFIHGHPLYHSVNGPELYFMPYGPFPYAAQGLAMTILGPSIFSAKLSGIVASIFALVAAYSVARQSVPGSVALAVVGFLAAYWIRVSYTTIYSRADVWMLLFSILGLWACARPAWGGAIFLGLCVGVSLNLKIHGPIYFLPVAGVALRRGLGWSRLFAAGAIALLMFLLPFMLLPAMSLANFVAVLTVLRRQGLDLTVFLKNFIWLAVVVAPLLGAFILSWSNDPAATRRVLRGNCLTLAGLVAATFVVIAIASKPGAGAPHLVPLATVTVLIGLQLWRDGLCLSWRTSPATVCAAFLFGLSVAACFGYGFFKIGQAFWSMRPSLTRGAYALKADTEDILRREGPSHVLLMGVGDLKSYPDTFYRCQLVFGGMPIGLAPNTVMDLKLGHMAPPSLALLRENLAQRYPGKSIVWLIPKGAVPFSWTFDDQFRAEFNLDYVRFDSTPCFDLYCERALSTNPVAPTPFPV